MRPGGQLSAKAGAPGRGLQARRYGQSRLEALNLAPEEVAAHRDVKATDERLAALLLAWWWREAGGTDGLCAMQHSPSARSARKMSPAQVPQMGLPLAANSRSAGS